jgi:Arc/MetJ-type ribon-helix-helix transcriptional regulator
VRILIETKEVNQDTPKVRLNLILRGDTARIMQDLRTRGIVRSYADCVNQAIRLFYEKIIEQDIRYARLKAFQSDLEGE